MDSSVVKAADLITPSPQFERSFVRTLPNPIEALTMLGSLEQVTRESLQSINKERDEKPVKAASPVQPTPVLYQTTRPEYQSAIQDRSLVEALLEFHRSASPETIPAAPKVASGFAAAQIPEVTANPKPSPLAFRKTPGTTQAILRIDPRTAK